MADDIARILNELTGPKENTANTEALIVTLIGRTIALDLLLRTMYAMWALSQEDPEAFTTTMIDGLVGQLGAAGYSPLTTSDQQMWRAAEDTLRQFRDQVVLRVRNTASGG